MRKLYLALAAIVLCVTSIWSVNLPVRVSTDPVYPTADNAVTIMLNTKKWASIDTTKIDVYTGLITSKSSDVKDSWQHVLPASWGDHPDSLKMKRVNDSIYSFKISKISTFYKIVAGESVFRITFIARDKSGHQTENLYFEVFGHTPTDTVSALPLNPTSAGIIAVNLNLNKTGNSLKAYNAAHIDSSVYVYTAATTNLGDWKHEVKGWGDVGKTSYLKTVRVSDSIVRFYVQPSANAFYSVTNPAEAIKTMNFVFRNYGGDKQTDNVFIPLVYQAPTFASSVKSYKIYPAYPTVNDNIYIFINANNLPRNGASVKFNPKSLVTAWTGLITST
jgi:hypothetical protein